MRRAGRLTAATGVGLAVAGGIGALVATLPRDLVWHQCVQGSPSLLGAGVRLALLRPDPGCASGIALGTDPGAAVSVVVTVAVPALIAQLVAFAVALGLAGRARRLLRRLAAWLPGRLPAEPALIEARRTGAGVRRTDGAPRGRTPLTVRRRGPPVGSPALAFG